SDSVDHLDPTTTTAILRQWRPRRGEEDSGFDLDDPGMQHEAARTFAQLLHDASECASSAALAASTDFYPVEVPVEGESPQAFRGTKKARKH
ncbi:MAG: hypothetical protein KDB19_16120, partial [Microthrixaceae bacterium]|nr:hypothetical protein [Microthrixaceae bacterium]